MESKATTLGDCWGGGEIKQKRKTQGHRQQCGDCWGWEAGGGGRGHEGINGSGKNSLKIELLFKIELKNNFTVIINSNLHKK